MLAPRAANARLTATVAPPPMKVCTSVSGNGGCPISAIAALSAVAISGALSTSVPSRSKTMAFGRSFSIAPLLIV